MMRCIFIFLLLTLSINVFSQELSPSGRASLERARVKVYSENGKLRSKAHRDSLIKLNFFVREEILRTTEDTIYYKLIHFDKSLFVTDAKKLAFLCRNIRTISLGDIKRLSPYGKVSFITLVSFKKDSTKDESRQIPKLNGKVDLTRMFEQNILTGDQTNKLIDILVNYGDTGKVDKNFCSYEPRNAIVFLNERKIPIGFIEICFQCFQFKADFENIKLEMCNEKFDAIQGFFMKSGINYGMNYNESD